MKSEEHIEMDKVYREMPAGDIPWNYPTPPDALVHLVESGQVRPCRAIDLGCGTGNYSIYLAKQGFDVTGVDISPRAIELAKENARDQDTECTFLVADVLGDMGEVKGPFDFAYGWSILHHVFPEQRSTYVNNVERLLKPGGKYLSVCFSEQDPQFGGQGKYRKTPIGTELYFSSEEELRELFEPHFEIIELKTIEVRGRGVPHLANYVFMKKR